jgi:hypothetical protein
MSKTRQKTKPASSTQPGSLSFKTPETETDLEPIGCAVVEEVPAACPRCKSTKRTKLEGSLVRNISGVSRDGMPFSRVRWSYCTCVDCEQRYRVIRRENVST